MSKVEELADRINGTNWSHYSAPSISQMVTELVSAVRTEERERFKTLAERWKNFKEDGMSLPFSYCIRELLQTIEESEKQ